MSDASQLEQAHAELQSIYPNATVSVACAIWKGPTQDNLDWTASVHIPVYGMIRHTNKSTLADLRAQFETWKQGLL